MRVIAWIVRFTGVKAEMDHERMCRVFVFFSFFFFFFLIFRYTLHSSFTIRRVNRREIPLVESGRDRVGPLCVVVKLGVVKLAADGEN